VIRIFLGQVGSGKTLSAVRETAAGGQGFPVVSNIRMPKAHNVIPLKAEHIIRKEQVKEKRDGTPVYELKLNEQYWKDLLVQHGAIDIIIDEAHQLGNARRSMSHVNIIMSDFMALLRRILGSKDGRTGRLTLITQLPRRLDVVMREMATQVRYHRGHWRTSCKQCHGYVWEHSDMPRPVDACPRCGCRKLTRIGHIIEVWEFASMDLAEAFYYQSARTWYTHYIIRDVHRWFDEYDTLQWEDMVSDIYT